MSDRFIIPETLSLSQSAISSFDACPAKFILSRNWSIKEEHKPDYFTFGSQVHALMESGETKPESSLRQYDKEVWKAVDNLRDLERTSGIEVIHREHFHSVFLQPHNIEFKRIIDAVGILNGKTVLIDYKTAGYKWTVKEQNGIAPKAHGWQSVSYLIPPSQEILDELGLDKWADSLVYLVAPKRGGVQMFQYTRNEEDEQEFYNRVEDIYQAWENRRFTKLKGYGCERCSMYDVCWDVKGWEEKFDSRRGK